MAEGFEHNDGYGERLDPIKLGVEASDGVRDMAILEGLTPEEIVSRGLALYYYHLKMVREGFDGPWYRHEVAPEKSGLLGGFLSKKAPQVEFIGTTFKFDEAGSEDGQ